MKHVINILLILILTGFAVGLAYIIHIEPQTDKPNITGVLYIPLVLLMVMLASKLSKDYK